MFFLANPLACSIHPKQGKDTEQMWLQKPAICVHVCGLVGFGGFIKILAVCLFCLCDFSCVFLSWVDFFSCVHFEASV